MLITGDGGDAHAAVALNEDVHGVLEHPGPQQQRRDVVEHNACTPRDQVASISHQESGELEKRRRIGSVN